MIHPENKMEIEEVAPEQMNKPKGEKLDVYVPISVRSEEIKSPYVRFLATYPKLILLGFLIASIGIAIYAVGVFNVLGSDGFNDPNSESARTMHYFDRYENVSTSSDLVVMVSHPSWVVDDAAYQNAYFRLKDNLVSEFPLSKIQSYFDYPDESRGMVSVDRHKAVMTAGLPDDVVEYEGKPVYTIEDFESAVGDNPLTVTFGGNMLSNEEVNEQIAKDLEKLEFGAFPVLLGLLVIAHGGIVAVSAPILLTIWSIICTFAALRLVALGFNVTTYATNVTTVFGVGLAMDFTLFTQLRFQEELHRHRDDPAYTPAHAVEKMLQTSGKTVIFSCIMIVCTMIAALQFAEYFITTMSLAILFPALFAAIGALTFIPALYIAMGENLFLLSTKTATDAATAWLHLGAGNTATVGSAIQPTAAAVSTEEKNTAVVAAGDVDGDVELGSSTGASRGGQDAATLKTEAENDAGQIDPESHPLAGANPLEVLELEGPQTGGGSSIGKGVPTALEIEEDRNIRQGMWFRLVMVVMDHPIIFLIATLGCLCGLMSVFFTKARFANQAYGNLPLDSPSRYIIETMHSDFPSSNGRSALDVYLQTKDPLGIRSASFLTMLDAYSTKLKEYTPYVVDVTSLTTIDSTKTLADYIAFYGDPYSPAHEEFTTTVIDPYALTNLADVTRISVLLSFEASDEDLGKVVRYVRRLTAESFKTTEVVDGVDTQVQTLQYWGTAGDAEQYDRNKDIGSTIPYVIAVTLPCVFVFILLLTGSVVMPFKAIITTFLSLCASFGFLVLIIQEGHGSDLLEFRNNLACLDPLQMIFIFLVAFGLSLDYEIFMLGRVQEIYRKTGDNKYAVARGIETSSRSVTMAALLLCTAVGGFLASEILLLKQIGVGIGLTIVIDATFVRCILVPAAMGVLGGDLNWWAPKPVKDFVEYVGLREEE